MRNASEHERGQTLVEFALAVTVMFAVLFGICDFGRALYTYDLVTSAARIGSRYAIVHGSSCALSGCPATSAAIQTYVLSKVTGVNASTFAVTTTWATAPGCTDSNHQGPLCIVNVTVTYPFKFLLSFKRTLTMTSTSQMVISQ
jgi:Flp pilus assembly protein TadG